MNNDFECKKCHNQLCLIGPFAREEKENGSVLKSESVFDYQCVNDDCENKGKIVKLKFFKKI